jgi:glycerophosphoryl diester phosphodiesterase
MAPPPERLGWLRQWAFAHRGWHGPQASENSPAAFAAAIAAGLGIECDVHRSRDGVAIVFHDWELDRLTRERGPLAARPAQDLAHIELAAGGSIPTLSALLELTSGDVPLLIELKSRRDTPVAPLCESVARALDGYAGLHAVMSFDPRVGHWFADHYPALVRGLVVSEARRRSPAAALRRRLALWRSRAEFLAYDVRGLPSRFADAQRRRGMPLLTWTVASAAQARISADHADAPIAEGTGMAAILASRDVVAVAAGASSP